MQLLQSTTTHRIQTLELSHQYFHLFFFLFRPEPTNQTMVLYVPTTDMGFTIEADKMIHQSVATLAHTDNYKLPNLM